MQTNVLVIDDCLMTTVQIEDLLEDAGMQVQSAHTPKEVRKVVREKHFDLVIFDFNFHTVAAGVETNQLLADLGYQPKQRILFTKADWLLANVLAGDPSAAITKAGMDKIRGEGVKVLQKIPSQPGKGLAEAIQELVIEVIKDIQKLQASA